MAETEKKFVIKHTFKNVKKLQQGINMCGEEERHYTLDWSIYISRNKDHYHFGLLCQNQKARQFSVDTEIEFRLIGESQRTDYSRQFFGGKCLVSQESETVKCSEIDKYIMSGGLSVEIEVKILNFSGVMRVNPRFDESQEEYSDVVLVVDDEKFYLFRAFLASRSTYFNSLFTERYKESKELALNGIDFDDFQNFLKVLYSEATVTEENLKSVLEMATMYGTKCVLEQAEKFLLETSTISKKEKLELAVKYDLGILKEKCMSELKPPADFLSIVPEDPSQFDASLWN